MILVRNFRMHTITMKVGMGQKLNQTVMRHQPDAYRKLNTWNTMLVSHGFMKYK